MEISGKLVGTTGRPVAGETLALISPQGVPESAVTTGSDGSFRAKVWRPGEYRLVSIADEESERSGLLLATPTSGAASGGGGNTEVN